MDREEVMLVEAREVRERRSFETPDKEKRESNIWFSHKEEEDRPRDA